jgi:2-polyprenyl-6-methoxyphenol hydroxylase-like FAD-dependent oxidoreductase
MHTSASDGVGEELAGEADRAEGDRKRSGQSAESLTEFPRQIADLPCTVASGNVASVGRAFEGRMRRILDVAVVGAGIAGLSAATMLARAGHRVVVFERFDAPAPVGSGLMLQPTGLTALERLGCRLEIEALGERIERLHGATTSGTTVFSLYYAVYDPDLYAVAVHRAALHGVLWRAFARSGADLACGRAVVRIDVAGTKAALVDAEGRVSAPFDLVLDASGAWSRLRDGVYRPAERTFSYGAVWATVPDLGIAPRTLAQRYVEARVMIGYLPVGRIVPDGRAFAALFWSLKPQDHGSWRDGFEAWRTEAAALWPQLEPALAAVPGPDAFTLASYAHVTARKVWYGPVALIGDAAHATSPQLGQGANHALVDAVVLADALAVAPGLPAALALYAARRKRHVRFYQLASRIMTPFFQSDSRVLARVRDLTFDRLQAVPYLRREMVRTLAGLKTGLFTAAPADAIVDSVRRPVAPQTLETAG